jgi:hypothetical protein
MAAAKCAERRSGRMPSRSTIHRKAYDDPHFNKIASAIGYVCINWARIEDLIDSFIEIIAPLEHDDISRAITSTMEIRNKIQTLKALAYRRKISDE